MSVARLSQSAALRSYAIYVERERAMSESGFLYCYECVYPIRSDSKAVNWVCDECGNNNVMLDGEEVSA